jgi:glutaredoxin-like protein NrdH
VVEFLSRRSIPHESRDIAEKEEWLNELVNMGYMATPVTLIGDEAVVGFDADKLNKVLRRQGFAGS